jgi:epoxyqueuosine reductase
MDPDALSTVDSSPSSQSHSGDMLEAPMKGSLVGEANDCRLLVDNLRDAGVTAWGIASNSPLLPAAPDLPWAVSYLYRVVPEDLIGLDRGPTAAYFQEYERINRRLVETGEGLVRHLEAAGRHAFFVDDDAPDGPGDPPIFSSKTAATRAGLGWIGKTALLVTPAWGTAVRLGTVFTDAALAPGKPVERSRCGRCHACVDACPARAGRDVEWRPGMPLDLLFDAAACDQYQQRYPEFDTICGICTWACPMTRRSLRESGRDDATRAAPTDEGGTP